MADYTDQDINGLLPGEPWTSAKAIAAFENPVAIAEGAPGAPVLSQGWVPYDRETNGQGNGLIWSFDDDGAVATVESPEFVDGYEYRFLMDRIGAGPTAGANYAVTFAVYRQTSATWSANTSVGAVVGGTGRTSGFIDVHIPRFPSDIHFFGAIKPTAPINLTVSVLHPTVEKLLHARFQVGSGVLEGAGARIIMLKRKFSFE